VLAQAFTSSEGDLTKVQIPVCSINPGDKKDSVLRRYAKDWIKLKIKDIGIDARFETLPRGTSFYNTEGEETPVVASLTITWWPKRPETEMELLQRRQREWKGNRPQQD